MIVKRKSTASQRAQQQLDDNGEEKTLYQGDSMHTGNGTYHAIANNTDNDMVFFALDVVY